MHRDAWHGRAPLERRLSYNARCPAPPRRVLSCPCRPLCSEISKAVADWIGPNFNKRDGCFSSRTDSDYDHRAEGISMATFVRTFGPWIKVCRRHRKARERYVGAKRTRCPPATTHPPTPTPPPPASNGRF